MRAALDTIQQIESYLLNELTSTEKAAFELELSTNSTLKSQVEIQQQLVQGIQRMGLKASAKKAKAKYHFRKWMIGLSIVFALITLSSFSYIYLNSEGDCIPCDKEVSNAEYDYPSNCCFKLETTSDPIETVLSSGFLNIGENCEEEIANGIYQESDTIIEVHPTDNEIKNEGFNSSLNSVNNEVLNPEIISDKDLLDLVQTTKLQEIRAEPSFPGGEVKLMSWLAKNTVYPKEAIEQRIGGTVYVDFVVSKSGKIKSVKVKKSVHPILDAAAVATINKMPDWNPGQINGQLVDVNYSLPINYLMQQE